MDVFDLRERLVSDYASYVRSFINVRDERIYEWLPTQPQPADWAPRVHPTKEVSASGA